MTRIQRLGLCLICMSLWLASWNGKSADLVPFLTSVIFLFVGACITVISGDK